MQTSALVAPFNVVLKELVVLVKGETEDAAVRSAVKKAFRVFTPEGTTYIDEYGDDLAGTPWTQVLEGFEDASARERAEGMRAVLTLLAEMHAAGILPAICNPVISALASGDPEGLHTVMFGQDSLERARSVVSNLDSCTRDALKAAGCGRKGAMLDIMQDLDLESMMRAGPGSDGADAMSALLGRVTQDIAGRIERGDIDQQQLLSEATGVLGLMQSGGIGQLVQGLMGGTAPTPGPPPAAEPQQAPRAKPAKGKGGGSKKK
jgi:hypothetical protein